MKGFCCIYKITCSGNKKIYVGSAKDFIRRKTTHISSLRTGNSNCKKLQRAYSLYGENSFSFDIIETVLSPEMLADRESYWINKLNAVKGGLNISRDTLAPMLGRKHSEKTKQLISNASKKHRHSEETKLRLSIIKRGKSIKKHSPEIRRRASENRIGSKNPFYGKKHSAEVVAALIKRLTGHRVSDDNKAKLSIAVTERHRKNRILKDSEEYMKLIDPSMPYEQTEMPMP